MINEACNNVWDGTYQTESFIFMNPVQGSVDGGESATQNAIIGQYLEYPVMSRYLRQYGVCPNNRVFSSLVGWLAGIRKDGSKAAYRNTSLTGKGWIDRLSDIKLMSNLNCSYVHMPERWVDLILENVMYSNGAGARTKALWQKAYIESLSLKA